MAPTQSTSDVRGVHPSSKSHRRDEPMLYQQEMRIPRAAGSRDGCDSDDARNRSSRRMCSTKDVFFSSTTSFPSYDSDASDATRRDAFHLQSYGVSIASSRARDILRGRVASPRVCQNRPPVTLPIPVIPKPTADAQSGSSTQYSLARFGSSANTRSNRLASDAAEVRWSARRGQTRQRQPPRRRRRRRDVPSPRLLRQRRGEPEVHQSNLHVVRLTIVHGVELK